MTEATDRAIINIAVSCLVCLHTVSACPVKRFRRLPGLFFCAARSIVGQSSTRPKTGRAAFPGGCAPCCVSLGRCRGPFALCYCVPFAALLCRCCSVCCVPCRACALSARGRVERPHRRPRIDFAGVLCAVSRGCFAYSHTPYTGRARFAFLRCAALAAVAGAVLARGPFFADLCVAGVAVFRMLSRCSILKVRAARAPFPRAGCVVPLLSVLFRGFAPRRVCCCVCAALPCRCAFCCCVLIRFVLIALGAFVAPRPFRAAVSGALSLPLTPILYHDLLNLSSTVSNFFQHFFTARRVALLGCGASGVRSERALTFSDLPPPGE